MMEPEIMEEAMMEQLPLHEQIQEPQLPPPTYKWSHFFSGTSLSGALVYFTIAHVVLLGQIQDSWMIKCDIWLYLISVLLLISNRMFLDLSVDRTIKVQKWRRICTILLCILVMVFSGFIYHASTEQWFKATISIASGILVVLVVVLHFALVELPEMKATILSEPKYRGSTMYYNILNLIPFSATFTFVSMPFGDPWSLFCNVLLCMDLLLIGVCMSKASQVYSVPNGRAEAMKWKRSVSFGMVMIPVLLLMHHDCVVWDSHMRNLSRIWYCFLELLVVVRHIVYVEMEKVREGGDNLKRN